MRVRCRLSSRLERAWPEAPDGGGGSTERGEAAPRSLPATHRRLSVTHPLAIHQDIPQTSP